MPVDCFVNFADMMRFLSIDKISRLLHVNCLGKISMQNVFFPSICLISQFKTVSICRIVQTDTGFSLCNQLNSMFNWIKGTRASSTLRNDGRKPETRAHAMMMKALVNQYPRSQNIFVDSLVKEARTRYVFFHVNQKWPVKIVPRNNCFWPKLGLKIWQLTTK